MPSFFISEDRQRVDTIPNIKVLDNEWIDVYAGAGLIQGTPITIENVGVADVYFTEQATQPPPDHDAYRILKRACCVDVGTSAAPSGVWVFGSREEGKINVRVGSPSVPDLLPAQNVGTPFGFELTPVAQASGQYGITDDTLSTLKSGAGADLGVTADGQYFVTNGDSGSGLSFAAINSRLAGPYRPGQGFVAIISAQFDENPVATSSLRAGLLNGSDSLLMGRTNNVDEVRYQCCGQQPIWHLTYTAGASGAETVIVEIDGVSFPVNLTTGNERDAAAQTSAQLGVSVPNWVFQQIGDLVEARSILSIPTTGAFSFTPDGGGTAAAAFVELIAGKGVINDIIPRSEWSNRNAVTWLDMSLLNLYRIRMQGIGSVFFEVEDPDTGQFTLLHTIAFPNSMTRPMFAQPSFRIGWAAVDFVSNTSFTVKGSEFSLFTPGPVKNILSPKSGAGTQANVPNVGHINLLTIKTRGVFGDRVNVGVIMPTRITASTDSTKGAEILIVKNAVFASELTFDFVDESNSIALTSEDGVLFVSGEIISTIPVGPDLSPSELLVSELRVTILPTESISVVMNRFVGGAATAGKASMVWGEII